MSDQHDYDVVVIGAGIAGATVAKIIAELGNRRILILEAGRNTGMAADKYQSHVIEFQKAEAKLPNSPYADNPNAPQPSEASLRQLVSPPSPGKAPASKVDDDTGYMVQTGPLPFSSSYTRALGGTTLHWLGTSLRMLPNDFELQSKYGHGVDWPIGYDDLKSYYERAETDIIGVSGDVADQFYPGIDESYFGDYEFPMERVPPSYVDQYIESKFEGNDEVTLGDETFHVRVSNSPQGRNSTPRGDYEPVGAVGNATEGQRCEGNSSCIPICPVQAKYNALKTLNQLQRDYSPLSADGNSQVTIQTQAVASNISTDEHGRVSGVTYKLYADESSSDFTEHTVTAKTYVLAAHAIEGAKLLLASGVANSSGQVGRNLMDHPLILTWGLLPDKVWSYRGPGSTSGIPAFRDGEFRERHCAFRVEVGNWGWSFAANAPYSTFDIMTEGAGGTEQLFGSKLRQKMSEVIPRQFRLAWEMEQIPEASNFVTIDDRYMDRIGNHRPVIRYDLPDYVRAGMEAARHASLQVFEKLGMQPLADDENPDDFIFGRDYTHYSTDAAGYLNYRGNHYDFEGAGHLAGTHRMGLTPRDSVLNKHQQSWDHDNLFMVGCGNMPTMGTANPTLTMTALAIQAGENIHKYLKRGGTIVKLCQADGIRSLEDLHEHLQFAIGLELTTIPVYLTGLYSIPDGANTAASRVIQSVVIEEMLHMCLAANVLNALAGVPSPDPIEGAGDPVPASFPTIVPFLPGLGPLDLRRFSKDALDTYMLIEHPGNPNECPSEGYGSIGAFYAAIKVAIDEFGTEEVFARGRKERAGCQIPATEFYGGGGGLIEVNCKESAIDAINLIVEQGEGLEEHKLEAVACEHGEIQGGPGGIPVVDGDTLADGFVMYSHYARFKEIRFGRRYRPDQTIGQDPQGDVLPVDWQEVYPMTLNPNARDYQGTEFEQPVDAFNRFYTQLVNRLYRSFNGDINELRVGVTEMWQLKLQADSLMKMPSPDASSPGETVGTPFEYLGS